MNRTPAGPGSGAETIRMTKRKDDQEEKGPPWMSSYADMITILLALFIMLFGMSTAEINKLRAAAESLRSALGGTPGPYPDLRGLRPGIPLDVPVRPAARRFVSQDEALRELQAGIQESGLQAQVQAVAGEQGIAFRIEGHVLFEPAQFELSAEAVRVLELAASQLIQYPSNPIVVEGHTDPERYPDDPDGNWKLAARRAYEVMRFLIDFGGLPASRMAYASCGEYCPLPDADNRTAVGRAMNRRVEIILLQTDEGNGTYFQDPTLKNPRTPLIQPGM
ncbi:MAG: flagellar motor protein MotB [bacterium]